MRNKIKLKNSIVAGVLLIAVSGLLAACSPGIASQNEVISPTSGQVQPDNADIAATEVVQADQADLPGDTENPAPPVPTARTGLESTDPGTVNLASGEIQLIEAFAFW